jgi:RimJ/RimL family protein N-acetyltransferase
MSIPSLTTPRLLLRAFTMDDVPALHAIMGQKGVLRYFPRSEPPPPQHVERLIQSILGHWQERGYGLWALESQSSGELMGRCGLQHLPETGEVEIDYLLGRTFWGQGLATEAARASLDWGVVNLALQRVVGISHVHNVGSQRVLQKLGMERLERREFFGMDCYYYAWDQCYQVVSEHRRGDRDK